MLQALQAFTLVSGGKWVGGLKNYNIGAFRYSFCKCVSPRAPQTL